MPKSCTWLCSINYYINEPKSDTWLYNVSLVNEPILDTWLCVCSFLV